MNCYTPVNSLCKRLKGSKVLASLLKAWMAFTIFLPSSSYAVISGLTTDSPFYSLPTNTSGSVQIEWQGTSDSVSTPLPPNSAFRILSTEAQIFDSTGQIDLTVRTQVSESLISPGVSPFNINERLRIPRSVLNRAANLGIRELSYRRAFIDESDSRTIAPSIAVATIRLSNASSGRVSIERIDLRFDDERVIATAIEQESLAAFAIVSHSGTGRLDAVWEIALPSSTRGTPVFTTLKNERRFLSGRTNTRIELPELPTQQIGRHILRLRVISPEITFSFNTLEYSILRGASLERIKSVKPFDHALVDANTDFSWQSVAGAASYLVEIYQREQAQQPEFLDDIRESGWIHPHNDKFRTADLVKGLRLHADMTSTKLSGLVLDGLRSGKLYSWRVYAYDSIGELLGASREQSMRFQASE